MERFTPRGLTSYKPARSLPEALCVLIGIADSPALKKLLDALYGGAGGEGTRDKDVELYLVGGCVRNAIQPQPVLDAAQPTETDLDLATNLSPSEVATRLHTAKIKVVETGIEHGTLLVVIDGVHIELTTFRQPSDRAHHTSADRLETDLSGRDFTINAIAFSVVNHSLIDSFNGIDDLNSQILRTVGDPHARFNEDPLRILRMVRFGPAQGRSIYTATLKAAKVLTPLLKKVTVERIKSELEEIIMSPCPAAGFIALRDLEALEYTIPELIPAVGFEQNRYHIHDVFDHTMAVLDRTPQDRILRWSAIFHDIGKPHTLTVDSDGERHFYLHELVSTELSWKRMTELKFSHSDMKQIGAIVRHHMRPLNCGPAGVRRLIKELGDNLQLWRIFKDADHSPTIDPEHSKEVAHGFDKLLEAEQLKMCSPSYAKLAIGGEDLKRLGIKPGPLMGRILKLLQDEVIDDPTRNEVSHLVARAIELAKL
jgi:tRNA nucleotidyltransferase (CCA-adding enzyme)